MFSILGFISSGVYVRTIVPPGGIIRFNHISGEIAACRGRLPPAFGFRLSGLGAPCAGIFRFAILLLQVYCGPFLYEAATSPGTLK